MAKNKISGRPKSCSSTPNSGACKKRQRGEKGGRLSKKLQVFEKMKGFAYD